MVAQHRAAIQLRQLKDRARDVGERRLRYGVEIPATTKAAGPDATGGCAAGDDEEEDEDDREGQFAVATPTLAHHSARWPVFEPPSLDDYVKAKLLEWIGGVPGNAGVTFSIAIVAPDADNKEVLAIAHETLVAPNKYYRRSIMVNVPAVHLDFLPLRPKEVLYYILRELEREEAAGSQKQPTDQGEWEEEDPDPWQDYYKKCGIYSSKKSVLGKIKRNIKKMNIYEKLDKIKSDIRQGQHKSGKLLLLQLQEKGADQVDLHVLLQLLVVQSQQDQAKNKAVDTHKLPEWNDNLIEKLAMRLKDHMEADEKTKKLNEQTRVEEETAVRQGGGGERKEDEKDERGDGEEEGKEERRDMEKGEERKEQQQEEQEKEGRKEEQNEDLPNRHIIGSCYGWIVTADERSELHLVNPITGEQIALPSVTTIKQVKPIYDDDVAAAKRIDKMINIEVLSNVKAQHHDNLEDIGKLCQLRKLGVVIDGKKIHLGSLLKAISDLHASLRSLSITIPTTTLEVTPSSPELQDIASRLKHHPEFLESLSFSGAKHLFPLLTKRGNKKLAKVTLSNTPLNQDDLKFFAQLPMLQCVRLRHISCTESVLNFKKDDFKCLKYLLIEDSNLTNITFEDEAACELEKMVLSSTRIESISGVHGLPKFEELELNSSCCGRLLSSCFYNVERIAKLTLGGTLLKQGDLRIIARELHICCLVLLEKSFDISQNQITFEKEEFIWLKLLSVDCSTITKINFITGSAPRLKKIVWSSFTSLSGINNLPRLKELEFNGYSVPNDVEEAIKNKKSINLKHNKP
uniref:Disease resistance R13L4/SHOC-2-like LRR domain-containing protein n=1 Tax=Oryza rufipogon TaxID=4529 RepID=A0A0E0RA41_ORYRU